MALFVFLLKFNNNVAYLLICQMVIFKASESMESVTCPAVLVNEVIVVYIEPIETLPLLLRIYVLGCYVKNFDFDYRSFDKFIYNLSKCHIPEK